MVGGATMVMHMFLGVGKIGNYRTPETIKFGLPLTIVALVVIIWVAIPWWKLIGFL